MNWQRLFRRHWTDPYSGTVVDLARNLVVIEGKPIPVEGTERKRAATVYDRLVEAGKRLMAVIQRNKGVANKDLAKFIDQINALCDKWDR